MREITLNPGDFGIGNAGCRIQTLLGSCVSITLWHPVLRIGAMSHFLLSSRSGRESDELDGRYGDEAIILMCRELVRHGANPANCQAKLFGGASMFPSVVMRNTDHVGKKNGETARILLRELGIPIVAESLFGHGHRKIVFDIATGDVWSVQRPPQEDGQLPASIYSGPTNSNSEAYRSTGAP